MARLRAGILGNIRGKVAGVVGSQWKDKNYLREYVKPANPDTAAQQTQRGLMSSCVAFSKTLVGPVFNTYTDGFQKGMSGFNFFIKGNINYFTAVPTYSSVKLTEGKLFSPVISSAVYLNNPLSITVNYDTSNGNNGAATDKVYAVAYDKSTGLWYFPGEEETRIDGAIDVDCAGGLTATNLLCWLFAIKYSGTLVSMISNSSYKVGEAA